MSTLPLGFKVRFWLKFGKPVAVMVADIEALTLEPTFKKTSPITQALKFAVSTLTDLHWLISVSYTHLTLPTN